MQRSFRVHTFSVFSLIVVSMTASLCGCGGGTTGTSSTTEIKIFGDATDSQGKPIANETMDVLDEISLLPLLSSGTDGAGKFQMTLPRQDQGVVVELRGHRTEPFRVNVPDSAVVSTSLSQDKIGQISFRAYLTASVAINDECSSMSVSNNTIKLLDPSSSETCRLTVSFDTSATSPSVSVAVVANCLGTETGLPSVSSRSRIGSSVLALAPSQLSLCSDARLVVLEISSALEPILLPIRD